jgi:hypothetical protein
MTVADLFWRFLALPLIHWLIVSLAIAGMGRLADARRLIGEARGAMSAPVPHRMAEISLRITRADGTAEAPRTYRTYRNPLRQWAWAIKTAFLSNGD